MYLMPLFSTFMSSLFSGFIVARYLGHRGTPLFAIGCLVVAFISSVFIWIEVVLGCTEVYINFGGPWLEIGTFTVSWNLFYDLVTAQMLFTVTGVSLAVHLYAAVYMRGDPHLNLFMSYLSLFTFFMLVLVTGDNLLVMLVGWEGYNNHSLNGILNYNVVQMFFIGRGKFSTNNSHIRTFYKARIPARERIGYHSFLFEQICTGALLGDGWFEKRGLGARLGIRFDQKFADVAQWYELVFYALGYSDAGLQNSSRTDLQPVLDGFYGALTKLKHHKTRPNDTLEFPDRWG